MLTPFQDLGNPKRKFKFLEKNLTKTKFFLKT